MRIPLTEPTAPRYIYVNPKTNVVHLLLPVVSGTDIGLDNTCKSVFAVQEFFGKSADVHQRAALDELMAYQGALEFDISLLDNALQLKQQKQERLQQIKEYIEATKEILKSKVLDDLGKPLPSYPVPLQKIMTADNTNVHSMRLRPKIVDASIRFINPIFSVNHTNESIFYNALTDIFKSIQEIPSAKARIASAVLASEAGKKMDFAGIQQQLQIEFKKQLDTDIDFTKAPNGNVLNQAVIDDEMIYGEDNPASSKGYIDALFHLCAQAYFAGVVEPPFYSVKHVDELSNITQFFLAHINIYCFANKISATNFGAIFDASKELSTSIAEIVQSCIQNGTNAEDALLAFVNKNSDVFGLSNLLLPVEQALIKRQFTRHFAQIKEVTEFDEFIVLDATKKGPFFPYQNAISVHFADFVRVSFPNLKEVFFKHTQADFATLDVRIPPINLWIHQEIELSFEELLKNINTQEQLNDVLKKLPDAQKNELMKEPKVKKLQAQKFLDYVARGQQKEAGDLLKTMNPFQLLLQSGTFTDYSGRTFDCTAYEYAYWAKDKHMLRLLERYITQDEDVKKELFERCTEIENNGLNYTQDGQNKNSEYFDFIPLKTALNAYADGLDEWIEDNNTTAINEAWMNVGKAQRDVPAHVADEYCRPDRSFAPTLNFDEDNLPRHTPYYNCITQTNEFWYPSMVSESAGLGVNLAVFRGGHDTATAALSVRGGGGKLIALIDLTALNQLDKARTEDLKKSLEALKPSEPNDQPSMFS